MRIGTDSLYSFKPKGIKWKSFMLGIKGGDSSAQHIVKLWHSLSDGIVGAESSREFSKLFFLNMENVHGKIHKDYFCLRRTVNRKLLEVRSVCEGSKSAFVLL